MNQATLEYTVLVVDDDPDIVLGLQDLLDHDGYQVGIARTCRKPSRSRAGTTTVPSCWIWDCPMETGLAFFRRSSNCIPACRSSS